jgi:hypothetical protein
VNWKYEIRWFVWTLKDEVQHPGGCFSEMRAIDRNYFKGQPSLSLDLLITISDVHIKQRPLPTKLSRGCRECAALKDEAKSKPRGRRSSIRPRLLVSKGDLP